MIWTIVVPQIQSNRCKIALLALLWVIALLTQHALLILTAHASVGNLHLIAIVDAHIAHVAVLATVA